MSLTKLQTVLREQYGFKPSPKSAGDLFFSGIVPVEDTQLAVELRFYSDMLLEPPVALLCDWEHDADLRARIGTRHIDSKGQICYFDDSRDVWDCTQSVPHTVGAIEKIRQIVSHNIQGHEDTDWLRDFGGYWHGEGSELLLSAKPGNNMRMSCWEVGSKQWLVDDRSPPTWLKPSSISPTPWHVVKLPSAPVPTSDNWPPKTLKDVITWMSGFLPNAAGLVASALCREKFNKKNKQQDLLAKAIVFYWGEGTGSQYFAIKLKLHEKQKNVLQQGRIKGLAALLASSMISVDIERKTPIRADPNYIHCRSLPENQKTLKGKRILQIGAGAIGGYVAQQLAALGAGWGSKSCFTIVDNDVLSPANVGRHILGMDAVGKPKATALTNSLKSSYPHLNIAPIDDSILRNMDAFSPPLDLVINATGSEQVGIALEAILRHRFKSRPPIVHGWILGHGLAAQTFIRRSEAEACFHCLWDGEGANRRRRHELSKNSAEDTPTFAPCHQSFYPFVVSAATTAANLITMAVTDWLQDKQSSSLRHIILQPEKCFNRPESSPKRKKECTVCG